MLPVGRSHYLASAASLVRDAQLDARLQAPQRIRVDALVRGVGAMHHRCHLGVRQQIVSSCRYLLAAGDRVQAI